MTKDQKQTEQAVSYLIDDLRNLVDLTTWQQDVVDRAAAALSQVRGKEQEPEEFDVRCPECSGTGMAYNNNYKCEHCNGTGFVTRLLYAAAPQSDAQQSSEKDAERYRWLRHADLDALAAANWGDGEVYTGEAFDAAIDAALAKEQG